jgi:hypothetical protein
MGEVVAQGLLDAKQKVEADVILAPGTPGTQSLKTGFLLPSFAPFAVFA